MTLNACTCLSGSSRARQEGKLRSFYQVVNYLLATCATDDTIAETDMDLMNFLHTARRSEHSRIHPSTWDESPTLWDSLRRTTSQWNINRRTEIVNATDRSKLLGKEQVGVAAGTRMPRNVLANLQSGKITPESGQSGPAQTNMRN